MKTFFSTLKQKFKIKFKFDNKSFNANNSRISPEKQSNSVSKKFPSGCQQCQPNRILNVKCENSTIVSSSSATWRVSGILFGGPFQLVPLCSIALRRRGLSHPRKDIQHLEPSLLNLVILSNRLPYRSGRRKIFMFIIV